MEEYLKQGFNGSKSYQIAYQTDNREVAKAEAYKLLRMPKIQDAIEATEQSYRGLAREMALDRRSILLQIRDIMKNGKPMARLSAINTLCKLKGDFAPQRQEIDFYESGSTVDITKLSSEEQDELRQKLLSEI